VAASAAEGCWLRRRESLLPDRLLRTLERKIQYDMKSVCLTFLIACLTCTAYSQPQPQRSRILGIDHVSFYTTQPDGVRQLYTRTLGLASAEPIELGETARYIVGKQWIGYSPAPDPNATDRMDHVAFLTDNVAGLRDFLIANNIKVSEVEARPEEYHAITLKDPEGHRIEFVQRPQSKMPSPPDSAVSRHMIHVGFLVRNRDAEDHFYRDLLGFHLYWHGGMKPNETDWVAMQVPDGTDWLEYMLHQPEHPDLQVMGVLNHISLGVADMKKAQAILESHGWKPHGAEKAQMGKDGKWQLNIFDPDHTRIELMEFKPVEKPCCADFTGQHPSE
jgi:catechol 2,3-dioxygenase-like lactoylglutathione lyase family enzyme